ncbi:ABC transporter permease [Paenibacillus sp. HJGM_3]|uniref:ABC transporter permease n=1 Tax=Paenibacillus sp. HJGM_3 TaxID=3379816 RepID=UPI00385C95BD
MNVPHELWRERYKRHLALVSRYTRDMGRSGFFMFLLMVLIGLGYFYQYSLPHLSADFPYSIVLIVLLLPLTAISPLRTLLRDADTVFLLSLESAMASYFRAAFRYSLIGQALLTIAVVLAASPLYVHGFGDQADPVWALLLLALALKVANLLHAWKEANLAAREYRIGASLFKWIVNAAVWLLFLKAGFLIAGALFLVSFGVAALAYPRLPAYRVHWTELLAREAKHQSFFFLFFSWFTDVDELPHQVRRRSWLKFAASGIRFRPDRAYLYLYTLTLIRSELTGIVLRLLVLACALIVTSRNPWLASGLYLFFALVIHVQLSALRELHAHAVMPALYPLPPQARRHAVAAVAFRAQLAVLALLTAALAASPALTAPMASLPLAALGAAAAMRARMRRA